MDAKAKFLALCSEEEKKQTLGGAEWLGIPAEYVNVNQLESFELCNDALLVKSRMGSGKTKAMFKAINNGEGSVYYYLTTRRTLARECVRKCKKRKINYYHYKEMEKYNPDEVRERIRRMKTGEIANEPIVYIVQVESLASFMSRYRPCEADLLVMDESTSLLKQLESPTNTNFQANLKALEGLVKNSKKVLCLCADMDQRTIDFISALKPNCRALINSQPVSEIRARYVPKRGVLISELVRQLKKGYNLFVVCVNKQEQKRLHKLVQNQLPSIKTLMCNSETVNDQKAYSFNTEEENEGDSLRSVSETNFESPLEDDELTWGQYQLVSITQTYTVGVSFEEEHFDNIFVLGDSRDRKSVV